MEMYPGKKEGSCSETRDGQLLQVLTAGHVHFILEDRLK